MTVIKEVKNDFLWFYVKQQTPFLQSWTWVSSNGIGLLHYLSNSKDFYFCRLDWTMSFACNMHAKEFFSPKWRRPFEEIIYSQHALAIRLSVAWQNLNLPKTEWLKYDCILHTACIEWFHFSNKFQLKIDNEKDCAMEFPIVVYIY